jgi:hypothetical protein
MNTQEILDTYRERVADLEEQVHLIHKQRHLWRSVMDAMSETGDPDASQDWMSSYACMYVVWQAMAVRRTIRGGPDTYVWTGVLDALEVRAAGLTVDAVLESPGREAVPEETGERGWLLREWFDAQGRFRCEVLRTDRAALNAAAKHVIDVTDRSIAHLYPHVGDGSPSMHGELDGSIDTLTQITRRYRRLITGVDRDSSIFDIDFEWSTLSEAPFLASTRLAQPVRMR